jgi:hypothetical protein
MIHCITEYIIPNVHLQVNETKKTGLLDCMSMKTKALQSLETQ